MNATMRITRDTTDEEIYAPVNRTRETIAKSAGEDQHNSEILAGGVVAMAEAEGVARAQYTFRLALVGMLDQGHSEEDAIAYAKEAVTGLLLATPNDTWSGRRNDARRAFADGLREAAAYLIRGY